MEELGPRMLQSTELSELLVTARESNGVPLQQVAEGFGRSVPRASQALLGRVKTSYDRVVAIARSLGLSESLVTPTWLRAYFGAAYPRSRPWCYQKLQNEIREFKKQVGGLAPSAAEERLAGGFLSKDKRCLAAATVLFGHLFSLHGNTESAVKLYRAALDSRVLDPMQAGECRNSLGQALILMGRESEGTALLLETLVSPQPAQYQTAYAHFWRTDTDARYPEHLDGEALKRLVTQAEEAEEGFRESGRVPYATASKALIGYLTWVASKTEKNKSAEALEGRGLQCIEDAMEVVEMAEEAAAEKASQEDGAGTLNMEWVHCRSQVVKYRALANAFLYPDDEVAHEQIEEDLEALRALARSGIRYLLRDINRITQILNNPNGEVR